MLLPLNEYEEVKLDANGNGFARVGPTGHGVTWLPERVDVGASKSTYAKEAACTLYVGSIRDSSTKIDYTATGSTGDTSERIRGRRIRLGEYIWAAWTGGNAGAIGRLRVTGQLET